MHTEYTNMQTCMNERLKIYKTTTGEEEQIRRETQRNIALFTSLTRQRKTKKDREKHCLIHKSHKADNEQRKIGRNIALFKSLTRQRMNNGQLSGFSIKEPQCVSPQA